MATQPTFLPHVHLLARAMRADQLVLLTSAQHAKKTKAAHGTFSTRQNSTRLVSPDGAVVLTVPVTRGRAPINETLVTHDGWQDRHLRTIEHAYAKAPNLSEIHDDLVWLLHRSTLTSYSLADLTMATWLWALGRLAGVGDVRLCLDRNIVGEALKAFCPLSSIVEDRDVMAPDEATGSDWMLALARRGQHDRYLAGKTAVEDYLDVEAFEAVGIEVAVEGFRPRRWTQRSTDFEADVSIVDLAANVGWSEARRHLLVGSV